MGGRRLPRTVTNTDQWLAAVYERLGDVVAAVGELVALQQERAEIVASAPAAAAARLTVAARTDPTTAPEPAPAVPGSAVPPAAEPAPAPPAAPAPPPPPRAGRGSSLTAWRAYADTVQVTYPADASRDDIIAACEAAGVIPASPAVA